MPEPTSWAGVNEPKAGVSPYSNQACVSAPSGSSEPLSIAAVVPIAETVALATVGGAPAAPAVVTPEPTTPKSSAAESSSPPTTVRFRLEVLIAPSFPLPPRRGSADLASGSLFTQRTSGRALSSRTGSSWSRHRVRANTVCVFRGARTTDFCTTCTTDVRPKIPKPSPWKGDAGVRKRREWRRRDARETV